MKPSPRRYNNYIEYLVIGFIFLVLFALPILFTRIDGEVSWLYVRKIWKDQALLIPLFALNHWLYVPKLLFRKRYTVYILSVVVTIMLFTATYYYSDEVVNKKPSRVQNGENRQPDPIPPYAGLLMYSLLIVGVDSGMLFSKKWNEIEERRHLLEKKNSEMQLEILRNQISPHFFMNTLNNIYALIDTSGPAAKAAVMKLSKLMRYMLYENGNGKVKLSKEFEFIGSYIDLMKIRHADEITIHYILPEMYIDVEIPPMLFIFYIENAFKYGASYQNESFISIVFEVDEEVLRFNAVNTKHSEGHPFREGGLGLENSENRLKLLFGSSYTLAIQSTEKLFNVSLTIPLS